MGPETEYALIPLTKGQFAIVDLLDYGRVAKHKWQAYFDWKTKSFYARTCLYPSRLTIGMHRMIAGITDKFLVDHANRKTLDNRSKNLRYATNAQNVINSKTRDDNRLGLKGVSRDSRWSNSGYRARITVDGKRIYLGMFPTPAAAFEAYKTAAHKYFGEFARPE